MGEKPFVSNAVWQDKLEKVAQEAPQASKDYKKIFEETDSFNVDVVSVMEDLGVKMDSTLDTRESGKSECMDAISAYLAHASKTSDIITVTHNPPVSKTRSAIKRAFLKVVCWPSRRYLYAQINYNNDMVRANQEMLHLLAKINRSDRDSAEKAEKELAKANARIAELENRIEELSGALSSRNLAKPKESQNGPEENA